MAKKREQRQAMYYNTSANAYKYDVSVEEYYDDAPQTAAAPAAAPRPKKKLRAIVTGAAVAAFCLALGMVRVAQYERLSAANLRVNKLRSTISSIEEEIETLNVKLEYAMDINSVQLIARDELGMDYPEHEQVVAAALPEAPAMPPRPRRRRSRANRRSPPRARSESRKAPLPCRAMPPFPFPCRKSRGENNEIIALPEKSLS